MPPLFFPLLPLAKLSLSLVASRSSSTLPWTEGSQLVHRSSPPRIELLKLGMEPQPTDLAPPTPFSRRSGPDQRDLGTVGLLGFIPLLRALEERSSSMLYCSPSFASVRCRVSEPAEHASRVPKPFRSVRIHSTMLVHLLHRFVFLPSGISGTGNAMI